MIHFIYSHQNIPSSIISPVSGPSSNQRRREDGKTGNVKDARCLPFPVPATHSPPFDRLSFSLIYSNPPRLFCYNLRYFRVYFSCLLTFYTIAHLLLLLSPKEKYFKQTKNIYAWRLSPNYINLPLISPFLCLFISCYYQFLRTKINKVVL